MKTVVRLWDALDGKKTILGYLALQIPAFGDDNVVKAVGEAIQAWIHASSTGEYSQVLEPTAKALAQLLLFVGVSHKAIKEVKASSLSL